MRLALRQAPLVTSTRNRGGQQIVRQFDAISAEVMLVPEQMPVDEGVQFAPGEESQRNRIVDRVAVAEAAFGDQVVFDESLNPVRLIGQAGPVEIGDDRVLRPLDQRVVETRLAVALSSFVGAATEQAEQRRFDRRGVPRRQRVAIGDGRPGRQETDDGACERLRDEMTRPVVVDGLHGGQRSHGQQAHAVAPERRHGHPPLLQVGEEVLAEGEDDLVRHQVRIESQIAECSVFEPAGDGRRNPVFDEIGQVFAECGDDCRDRSSQREDLLELIEDEDWTDEAILPGPELLPGSVEVLPECFSVSRIRMLDPLRPQLGEDRQPRLLEWGFRAGPDLQPEKDGQQAFLSETREHSGLEERGLAQAGLAEQHRDRLVHDPAEQLIDFRVASAEEGV